MKKYEVTVRINRFSLKSEVIFGVYALNENMAILNCILWQTDTVVSVKEVKRFRKSVYCNTIS